MDYLPVFLNLRDKLALVVGGGAVASRKVELLLKAHARVRVVAPQLHSDLALYRDAGRIEHLGCRFEPRHFDGAIFDAKSPAHDLPFGSHPQLPRRLRG